jgi:hypothetical protein
MFPGPAKKNKFLSSSTTTTTTTPKPRTVPEEPTATAPPAKPNPFLSRALQQAQAQAPQQAQAQAPQQAQAQAPVEEFPVLSKGVTAASVTATAPTATATANAYKSALLSKIDITHAEEQARIQRAVRREMERNEERRRQLELAARRERFVNAAMNRVNGMAYDDDDDSNDIDVDNN